MASLNFPFLSKIVKTLEDLIWHNAKIPNSALSFLSKIYPRCSKVKSFFKFMISSSVGKAYPVFALRRSYSFGFG